jgi:LPXTG-motif cell wall-anchored protein
VKRIAPLIAATFVASSLWFAAPAQAVEAPAACAAYNLCAEFPGSADRDCGPGSGEIGHPVQLVNPAVDPWRLDDDNDGIGCESESGPPPTTAPPSTAPPASPSPSKSPAASPSEKPSPSPSRSTAAAGVAGGDSQLAVTGAPVYLALVAGLVLVAAGAGLVAARRRRIRFVAR